MMLLLIFVYVWGAAAFAIDRLHSSDWYHDITPIDYTLLSVAAIGWPIIPLIQIGMIIKDKFK